MGMLSSVLRQKRADSGSGLSPGEHLRHLGTVLFKHYRLLSSRFPITLTYLILVVHIGIFPQAGITFRLELTEAVRFATTADNTPNLR